MRSRLTAALALTIALSALLAGCASQPEPAADAPAPAESAPSETATQEPDGTCDYSVSSPAAREVDAPPAEPIDAASAVLSTSAGDITIAFDSDRTPCTVSSFASLAEQGYFDETDCHRLTTSGIFVLQCGDPTGTGTGRPGYSFADELDGSETYPAGTVAMANAGPNTNGSQFFLVYEDTTLGPDYTVFGHMDEASTAIVAEIASAGTDNGQSDGAPAEPVTIGAVSID